MAEGNLRLLLADCRQALYDAAKAGDTRALLHEAVNAHGLMGRAMDALKERSVK